MIRTEQWMDIKDLHRQGLSQREIARQTGYSRNTIAKILSQKAPQAFQKPARKSCLDPYKPYLTERWQRYHLRAPRLLEEIRAQGYSGSINLVQRFVKTLKEEQTVLTRATVRFETAPGQQAQADWAYVGDDGQKIYAFVMVLSFSRMLYIEFTRDMETSTLIRCHQNGFAYFGGVPQSVLYDNMSQVRKPGGDWNPLFADFAAHYGFVIKTHQVRRPRTKGKVERMVDYLKENFLRGRTFAGFDDLAAQGRAWQEMANTRLPATTGERPIDLHPKEPLAALTLVAPYVLAQRQERKVDAEGFVRLASSRYSVPPQYVGKRVLVIQQQQRIQVQLGDVIIAEHALAPPGSCVAAKEHVEAMWQQTLQRSPTPEPAVTFTPAERVSVPPLSVYEEVAE